VPDLIPVPGHPVPIPLAAGSRTPRRAIAPRDVRPGRHALLELRPLPGAFAAPRETGDAARFDQDFRYRQVLHRLWIAIGNEALACPAATGQPVRADRTWSNL
jgi:hypothetical protein